MNLSVEKMQNAECRMQNGGETGFKKKDCSRRIKFNKTISTEKPSSAMNSVFVIINLMSV